MGEASDQHRSGLGRKPGKALLQKWKGREFQGGGRRRAEAEDGCVKRRGGQSYRGGVGRPESHGGPDHERRQMDARMAGEVVRQRVFTFWVPVLESQGKGLMTRGREVGRGELETEGGGRWAL